MKQELAKVTEGEGATEQQSRFVEALLGGAEPEEAKRLAAYSDSTPISSILRGKMVQNAIQAGCDARMRGDLRVKALKTLENLLNDGPAATKLGAAKLVLEWGEGEEGGDKPLTEMTLEELEAVVRRKEAELRDVTPDNGA